MNEDLKSFYTAVILSIILIFVSNYFMQKSGIVQTTTAAVTENAPAPEIENADTKIADATASAAPSVEQVLKTAPQIKIETPSLSGSLRQTGARIDNLWLKKYKQTLAPDSPIVELLAPAKTANPYYAEFGWLGADAKLKLPTAETLWNVHGSSLTPQTPITLEWNNGQGLRFITRISIDENYMFTIEQSVENTTNKEISLYPYGLIARSSDGKHSSNVVHEGMIGVVDNTLKEIKYDDLKKENQEYETTGGWLGFSDRYWFTSLILGNQSSAKIKFSRSGENMYQGDFVGAPINIAPGSVGNNKIMFYAGAKEIKLLDKYTKTYNLPKFDLAVDFGWYYFLTKPFFYILDFLYNLIGNMGWAILLFAALLRLVMFPVANKSFENMAKMKRVQPKINELREKFAEDKIKLQQEMMELYRKEKINPAAGCLPMFIQIPVFFSLYKVLNIAIEIRHAPFIGWIKDLSAPDPLTISVWSHLPIPTFLNIGIWPIVMGLTMYIQQKLNPAPANKDQARMFAMLPLIFMFMMGHFASGLVIYWTLSNILSIIQQKTINYKHREK